MRITAALAFYDETVEMIERCVPTWANIADRVLVLDGAFARFPEGRPRSDPAQVDAIARSARRARMECLILQPDRCWAGEIEKRTALMRLAAIDADWVAVVDTDHAIDTDRERTRAHIEAHPEVDVWSVDLYTVPNEGRPMDVAAASNWHIRNDGNTMPFPHLFRALPGLAVERFHWWYSALKGDERVWLEYGGTDAAVPDGRPVMPIVALPDYRIDHLSMSHPAERVRRYRAFNNDRAVVVALTGQEDDQPGLPEPVWDYSGMGF